MVLAYERFAMNDKCPACNRAVGVDETRKLIINVLLIVTIYLFFWYLVIAVSVVAVLRHNH